MLQSANSFASSDRTSAGARTSNTRNPGLIPNFLGSGVPEYPGIVFCGERPFSAA
jgi:hypothetical protein